MGVSFLLLWIGHRTQAGFSASQSLAAFLERLTLRRLRMVRESMTMIAASTFRS
jgi:hypothetical protein